MTLKLSQNIKKDKALAEKMAAGDLNCIDCFKLAAAVRLSELFPSVPVYLVPQQQIKPIRQLPPAVFVQTTNIHREKRLGREHEYQIGVNIAYMSKDINAQTEQEDAAMKLMDMAENIPPCRAWNTPTPYMRRTPGQWTALSISPESQAFGSAGRTTRR